MITTAVIDDHEAIRLGMSAALQNHPGHHVTLVDGAGTVPEFLERGVQADVVLLDLQLDDGSDPLDNAESLIDAGYKVLVYSIAASAVWALLVWRVVQTGLVVEPQ